MRPMIDDLELPQVQTLQTRERRALAEHRPPGFDGSLLQNLGRGPTHLSLYGVATGPEAQEFISQLDEKFRGGEPVTFIADIIEDTEIEEMLIDDLQVEDLAGRPDRFAYRIVLKEYIEPVEPEDLSPLEEDILGDAGGLIDDLVDGLDLALPFATGLEQFLPSLEGFLERLRRFRSDVDGASGGG